MLRGLYFGDTSSGAMIRIGATEGANENSANDSLRSPVRGQFVWRQLKTRREYFDDWTLVVTVLSVDCSSLVTARFRYTSGRRMNCAKAH